MKKFLIISLILFLVLFTAFIKNSTKRIDDEIFVLKENPPSRSAKLRYIIKKEEFYNFETDVMKKFGYLLEVENFGNKL